MDLVILSLKLQSGEGGDAMVKMHALCTMSQPDAADIGREHVAGHKRLDCI